MTHKSSDGATVPSLLPGVRVHRDQQRGRWVLLAPERVIELDEIAVTVLQRCDGHKTLDQIISELAEEYNAPAEEISGDVHELLSTLRDKRMLRW